MIFRFSTPVPNGKFEFTCTCGYWNQVFIKLDGVGYQHNFNCANEDCNVKIILWLQTTHWHMDIKGVM